jgi:hypothetical protein
MWLDQPKAAHHSRPTHPGGSHDRISAVCNQLHCKPGKVQNAWHPACTAQVVLLKLYCSSCIAQVVLYKVPPGGTGPLSGQHVLNDSTTAHDTAPWDQTSECFCLTHNTTHGLPLPHGLTQCLAQQCKLTQSPLRFKIQLRTELIAPTTQFGPLAARFLGALHASG